MSLGTISTLHEAMHELTRSVILGRLGFTPPNDAGADGSGIDVDADGCGADDANGRGEEDDDDDNDDDDDDDDDDSAGVDEALPFCCRFLSAATCAFHSYSVMVTILNPYVPNLIHFPQSLSYSPPQVLALLNPIPFSDGVLNL